MIYFLPWGDKNIASSRLRVHQIAPYLDMEYSFIFPHRFKKDDILVIQKKSRPRELEKAKREGAKVIYDLDDLYLEDPATQQMIKEADVVTVDTEYKRDKYLKKAVVIPDSLDWNGTVKSDYSDTIKTLAWTSYGNNAPFLGGIYGSLKEQYNILVISTPDFFDYFEENVKVTFCLWALEEADRNLSEADAGIIPFPDNEFCSSKSMHRLLKFWAIGLPCYVSPIPDYEKAVFEAGADEKCLVTDWNKLPHIEWSDNLREYALAYHPKNIAKLWASLFRRVGDNVHI